MEEVSILTSATDSNIIVLDPRNGTQLAIFKNNTSGPNGTAVISSVSSTGGIAGPGDYIVSTQNKGLALHFWQWGQEQPAYKCHTPEKITALVVPAGGCFCVGGSQSGAVYIWQVGTGSLVRSFEAHYRSINCIVTAGIDDKRVVTGGDDALVRVWSLGDLLEEEGLPPKPKWSGNSHGLPVTDLAVFPTGSRVVSTSLDGSAKVWEVCSGQILFSVACPSSLRSVALDPLGAHLYVGAVTGAIYELDLDVAAVATNAAHAKTNLSISTKKETLQLMTGHTSAVTSLVYSREHPHLVSTSEDGKIKVWHPQSYQCLRTFSLHKGAVSQVLLVPRPKGIFPLDQISQLPNRKKAINSTPFQPFKKYKRSNSTASNKKQQDNKGVDQYLDSIPCVVGEFPEQHLCHFPPSASNHYSRLQSSHGSSVKSNETQQKQNDALMPHVKELQDEVQRLKDQNERWQRVNAELMKKIAP